MGSVVAPTIKASSHGWRMQWLGLRDRLLASARFQRWATAFPLTRPIARKHVRALFDLCAGFVYSQILLACVRLNLFERLAEGPQSAASLAGRLSLPIVSAERLLRAAASLQLIEQRETDVHGVKVYGLGPLGAALLGNPGVLAMIEHHALLYADLRDPLALLRNKQTDTALNKYWAYAGLTQPATASNDQVAAYSGLMAASQPLIAGEVMAAYPFRKHRCLLDVGGGEGVFLCAVAQRAPKLSLQLFDLPAVTARAQERLSQAGLCERVHVYSGNLFADPLPQGADIATLVRVIHDHDDAAALSILRAVHEALPAGGVLLVAEPMSDTVGAEPIGDAYFGFYLLAMGSGRPRSKAELSQLLAEAGFCKIRALKTRIPLLLSLLLVHKG